MSFQDSSNYSTLRKAISERPGDFIAVVGAGLSAQCGLPTWKRLSCLLIDEAEAYSKLQEESGNPLATSVNFDKLRRDNDLWKVIGIVKSILQRSPFEIAVKKHLLYDNTPDPPVSLVNLWKLGIKGIVTPNLDSLAANAFALCYSKNVDVSTAKNPNYLEFLGDERHFVFQPHGQLGDTNSWILTPSSLSTLLLDASYRSWWDRVLSSRNLIFIGVNESDISIKSYILNNSSNRYHYVIAPVSAAPRFSLLQETGFLHVPYEVHRTDGTDIEDHSELSDIIESLVDLIPKEVIPPPAYEGVARSLSDMPNPDELQKLPINEVRQILNEAVASILPNEGDAEDHCLADFDTFRRKYLLAITGAAALEPNTAYDTLHHYKLLNVIGEGAFGRVYSVERLSDKKMFAIKVIHPQMLSSGGHLNAFRRGAYAMRLLTKRQVSGMAAFEEAFEVPFSIVMEYVDGQDLEDAIDNHFIESLLVQLKVMRRIAEVIYSAHSIKEQVLHRDLKPGNVLLSGYSYEDENPQSYVKIVDFDLCWHKYATAETIVHHKGSRGYAAPEMFDKSLGSTRSSSVDVYGLGMLLYYILTGNHPIPGMTNRISFEAELAEEIRRRYKSKWTALGWHLARCVTISTATIPRERCNIPDFISMLDTAIALEGGQDSSTYLPILGMQIMEFAVEAEIKVECTDFGRTIEHVRDVKSLKCELINERRGVSITARVRVTKDELLGGAGQEKRDHRVEKRIKRDIDQKKYVYCWTANRSIREATISTRISSPNFNDIKDFSSLIRFAWHEIEHN